jgi:hypothetical protein
MRDTDFNGSRAIGHASSGEYREDPDEVGGIYSLLVAIITMLMDDDGLNLLLLESAGVHSWVKRLLIVHVEESKRGKWRVGWPEDNELVTAAMWIMWWTTTKGSVFLPRILSC